MATIIKNVEPNFIDKLYIPGLIKGLLITIKHFFAKKITLSYPEEKHIPPPFYRGKHRLNKKENGEIKCVACEMCASSCPANAIGIVPSQTYIESDKEIFPIPLRFEIDLTRCIFCGFCERACPKNAIELTEIYDFAAFSKKELFMTKEMLLDVYEATKNGNYYK